jgi:hypothetical protein
MKQINCWFTNNRKRLLKGSPPSTSPKAGEGRSRSNSCTTSNNGGRSRSNSCTTSEAGDVWGKKGKHVVAAPAFVARILPSPRVNAVADHLTIPSLSLNTTGLQPSLASRSGSSPLKKRPVTALSSWSSSLGGVEEGGGSYEALASKDHTITPSNGAVETKKRKCDKQLTFDDRQIADRSYASGFQRGLAIVHEQQHGRKTPSSRQMPSSPNQNQGHVLKHRELQLHLEQLREEQERLESSRLSSSSSSSSSTSSSSSLASWSSSSSFSGGYADDEDYKTIDYDCAASKGNQEFAGYHYEDAQDRSTKTLEAASAVLRQQQQKEQQEQQQQQQQQQHQHQQHRPRTVSMNTWDYQHQQDVQPPPLPLKLTTEIRTEVSSCSRSDYESNDDMNEERRKRLRANRSAGELNDAALLFGMLRQSIIRTQCRRHYSEGVGVGLGIE